MLAGQVLGRQARRDRRLADRAEGRRGGAVRARFDRLGAQRARRRRRAHAGRAGLCDRQCRRHRRPVRRAGEDRRRRRASISATPCACTTAQRLRAGAGAAWPASASPPIPSARSRRSSTRWKRAAPTVARGARPGRAAQGDQEPGRDRRPPRRAGARRRGAERASCTGSTVEAPKGELDRARPPRPSCRQFREADRRARATCSSTRSPAPGPNGAIVHYRVERGDQPAARAGLSSIWSISGGQYADGTTDVTRTVRDRRRRPPRCATASPACSRAISRSPPRSSREGTRGGQLDTLRAPAAVGGGARLRARHRPRRRRLSRGARRAAAHRQAGAPRRRRRAAARRHDPLERARLLQDRRIRHPHRESGAGRAARDSGRARRRCSASRR